MLSFSRVRQYETIKIRENIELIMTTCIHRHLCTHIDIYLRYCYVTIMSFLNATAKSNTFVRSYSKGKWYTQGNHCLLPIFSYYRLIINRTCIQINLYIIFPRLVIWNDVKRDTYFTASYHCKTIIWFITIIDKIWEKGLNYTTSPTAPKLEVTKHIIVLR